MSPEGRAAQCGLSFEGLDMHNLSAVEPVMIPVNTMKTRYGIGRTKTYALINDGRIETRKIDGRTLIVDASVKRLFELEEAA